jgi:hypothetical protein
MGREWSESATTPSFHRTRRIEVSMNYTLEQTAMMIERYQANPGMETVRELANELGKSPKSIIGKLSKEAVYRRQVYKTKTGEPVITKADLVSDIADALGYSVEDLLGLEKAPKTALKKVLNGVSASLREQEILTEAEAGLNKELENNTLENNR